MIRHTLPADWREMVLGKAAKVSIGLVTTMTTNYSESGTPLIRNSNISENRINKPDLIFLRDDFADQYPTRKLQAGDIVTVHTGDVGVSAIVDQELDGCLGFATLNTRVDPAILLPEYLCWYFNSHPFISYSLAVSTGDGRNNLNLKDFVKARIPVPPLPEQQKIAAILSTWDRAIELTEKLILVKQKRKQALMQQLLTGKVRFAEFEGKPWKQVRLGDLLKEVKRMVEWDDNAEYHLLSIRRRSGGMFDRETKLGHDIKTKVMMKTETGDFVIARMQAVHGAITVTPPECHGKHVSGSYSTFVAKDPDKLHMPFLNYVSQTLSFYRLLLLSAYGVTIEKMTFNLPWFLNEKIEMPPTLVEQKRIADVFDSFERENAALGRRLDSLKQQKKGLMQQLLTGKVRVNVDAEMVKG
ncbi:restriction endonuclease subunit S [Bremerella sp. P1]|uniref:restriction endonuclease subunit S n=1 Tax=Bremerella sp. P1 TaxID=3026424 RepID=UPI00236850C5|nr:restriction endonuclease subunit S [Bremerella sp. P1]WDI39859.1 restriction endonuclease subunit S [Bremerella sp. P1]